MFYSSPHSLSSGENKDITNLIKQVDFCDCVGSLSRVLHQQCNKAHKGIQVVIALGTDHSGVCSRVVLLLSLSTIADFNTHFSAKTEESCDQVISFQDPLLMHLFGDGNEFTFNKTYL